MPIADMGVADFVAVGIDSAILIAYVFSLYNSYTKEAGCKLIEVGNAQLKYWRVSFYAAITSAWIIAYTTFIIPNALKFFFHVILLVTTIYTLKISLPAYFCKLKKILGTCNCDFYEYNDFAPMVVLGSIGTLVLALFGWTTTTGSYVLLILLVGEFVIFKFLPDKMVSPMDVPSSLLLKNSEGYQEFLMIEPEKAKLIIVVSNSCKFCDMQISEITAIPLEDLQDRVRVFDLSEKERVDKILLFTLNLDESLNFPIPLTFVMTGGICTDQKDGVISTNEINFYLS